jgi:glucosamine-6-phosphate deaminase
VEEAVTPLSVFPTPDALGETVAERLIERVEQSRRTGRRFLLGCPTGRTPKPIYADLTRRGVDFSSVVLVMMDEYLVDGQYAPASEPWSCHGFVRQHIAFPVADIWFPDPADPAAYDRQIADAGGIDFFLLASGVSDGHVAFNSPGSARDSITRVVSLSEQTRRDNLQTFPAFGRLANVPTHGVTVGIDTIARSREALMVVWGESKRLTLCRMRGASRYDSQWPATVIHECAKREIIADEQASLEPPQFPSPQSAP